MFRNNEFLSKLLSLTLLIVTSGGVLADQTDGNDNRKKRLKQGIYVGGAVVGGIVSWRVLRRLDYKLSERLTSLHDKRARRSRMPLSRFTKVEVTDPPLYRLTAPDGSQHHILGTVHISNISLSDFSTDSKLFPILEQANILMPERIPRFTSELTFHYHLLIRKWLRSRKLFTPQEKLSEQLGEEYWQKLTQMIAEKPDLKPFEQPLDEFMNEFDRLTAKDAYNKLLDYSDQYTTPAGYLAMDWQLVRYGHKHGKKMIGLETGKQSRKKSLQAEAAHNDTVMIGVDDLKKFIDDGGIDSKVSYRLNRYVQYAKGRHQYANWVYREHAFPEDEIMLDQRNIAWVESGKIQKNCVQGNKCLIFVGNAHLTDGSNTLIELLQKKGYKIENLCRQQMFNFC